MDGTPFGRYRLIELMGRGGMGEVWRAYDTDTDRVVAIKVLSGHLSEDEEFKRRFRREAHAATRLNSPHVIPIHNYGEIDGRLYLDMRLIEGRPLATVLVDGPLDPARAVSIVNQVAKALHAGHKIGLLHRDVKPSNVLLDEDDFAYLIDFGIARTVDETRMTKTGSAIGTLQYIAPERLALGADEDARADIYSLACVFYECLTGCKPFPGDTPPQLIAGHLTAPPPRPSVSKPTVPPSVDEVVARGMAKDPGQRYATTIELANAASAAVVGNLAEPTAVIAPPPIQRAPGPVTSPWPAGPAPMPGHPAPTPPVYQHGITAPWQPTQPPRKAGPGRGTIALITGTVALVVVVVAVAAISLVSKMWTHQSSPATPTQAAGSGSGDAIRVASSKLVTQSGKPKVVITFYEDFLCPACRNFEQSFGPTVANLVDIGAIAADYSMVSILDSSRTQHYSSRAGAAACCVADESIDAFRRFHKALFTTNIQPSESGSSFPDDARLIELARQAGAAGTVPDCINSGKYLTRVTSAAAAAGIHATPTVKINGQEYEWSTAQELVAKVKGIAGDVPGIDEAVVTPTP